MAIPENAQTHHLAYVSQINLLADETGVPIQHHGVPAYFSKFRGDHYVMRRSCASPSFADSVNHLEIGR